MLAIMGDFFKYFTLAIYFLFTPLAAQDLPPESPPDDGSVIPKIYQKLIAMEIKGRLRDPASVRDSFISLPFRKWMGTDFRYVVCIQFNAKNAYGAYTGPTDFLAIFAFGKLTTINRVDSKECEEGHYRSFPELNGKSGWLW